MKKCSGLVLSIFPGLGLLDRAFEEEGFTVVRGPDVLWGGDIRKFHPPAGRFDGVIGGPPCQSFSTLSNLVRAKGHEPRFGDLFPEFARVVGEVSPRWWLAENVDTELSRAAASSAFRRLEHSVHTFTIGNEAIAGDDGLGQEQERLRRFWFGAVAPAAIDLRRWIELAALMLPRLSGAVTQSRVDNTQQAKGRAREQAILGDARAVPVAIGGGGKRKREGTVVWNQAPGQRTRTVAVTASHSGAAGRPRGGHLVVYRWARMLELQGLPPNFLADAPFTVEGKRRAVGNGVPFTTGLAIARAVRLAIEDKELEAYQSGATVV